MVKVEVDNDASTQDNGVEEWRERVHRIGLAVAKRILPRELGAMRHNRPLLIELAEAFSVSSDALDTLPERLAEPVALGYVRLLAQPPGTAVSLLVGLDESAMEVKAEMFWRCALRLHMNTLEELEGMARRWSSDLEVDAQASVGEANPSRRKVQCISIVLPSYSMVCKTQKEIKESEVRKAGIEKMKKEAAEKEAKRAAEREKKHDDPNISRPVASSSPSSSTTTTTTITSASVPSKPPPAVVPRPNEQKGAKKNLDATAARHTYDNYGKWDDVDLDEVVDYTQPKAQTRAQSGGREKSAEEQALDAELNEKLQDPELRKHMMDVLGGQFTN